MNKTLSGGAVINYGPNLPDPTSTTDGQLFYKTEGNGQGLYVFSFLQDITVGGGDQVGRGWSQVTAPGLYVLRGGDIMAGTLEVPNVLRVTNFSNSQRLLIGNQDSGGVDRPVIFDGANGIAKIGYGTSWVGNGGTITNFLQVDGTSPNGLQFRNAKVWHADNDGSGSGLDADFLDGLDSASFRDASNLSTGTLSLARLPFTPVEQSGSSKIRIG